MSLSNIIFTKKNVQFHQILNEYNFMDWNWGDFAD